jgi:hypothetical protein
LKGDRTSRTFFPILLLAKLGYISQYIPILLIYIGISRNLFAFFTTIYLMRRLNPFASPFGFGLTLVLVLWLGFSFWKDRGLAFSPGAVTGKFRTGIQIHGYSSHADFEKQCKLCHEPLRTNLAEKCVLCHTGIQLQAESGQGLHAKIANLDRCQDCHPEHQGRQFDPTQASYLIFDHSITDFNLVWHQVDFDTTPMGCVACHTGEQYSKVQNVVCVDCHSNHDAQFMQAHRQDYGEDCLECHDGLDSMINFDHSATAFSLDGRHTQVKCTDCHKNGQLKGTPQACEQCHQEPTIHQGMFSVECQGCHTSQGWTPALLDGQPFNHATTTGFSLAHHELDYAGLSLSCNVCHTSGDWKLTEQTCISCHSQENQIFMDQHQEQFGTACLDCHDGVDRLSNFDHANFFPLEGRHAEIDCLGCHMDQSGNKLFRGTPIECVQCHAEPEIHAGIFGLQCQYCHGVIAWSPASLREHRFPLNHGLENTALQSECTTCHTGDYVEYTCYGCHDHQSEATAEIHARDGIPVQDLPACASCHPLGLVEEK